MAKVSKITELPRASTTNAVGNTANRKALQQIKARVIEVNTQKSIDQAGRNPSIVEPEDPFYSLSHKGLTIEPPFDMLTLAMLGEHNAELNQCVEAMEVNIEGFGHRFVPRVKAPDGEQLPKKLGNLVNRERVRLINFFEYATQESFKMFRRKLRKDLEFTGNCYFEVIRNAAGRIQGFTHIPSYQMRMGRLEEEPRLVDRKVLELQEDNSVKVITIQEWRRFRPYIQSKVIHRRNLSALGGWKLRWFKDFGDPKIYDNRTGQEADGTLEPKYRANEIIHTRIYSPRTSYGLPRYIGNLLSIFGDRAAEEVNFITFRNNNIPSMVVAVSNGQLTEGTVQRIESFVESQIQGSDNYSKFLILEAEGLMEGEDGGNIKMEIKPLTKEQHKDALFQNYSGNNRDQVRRAYRLPPIFVGRSDDYTRATAESSRVLADEQIFAPERDEVDELFNRIIFPEMEIVYHKYKSNSPNTTDNPQLVKILAGAEKTGGMTPRIARTILEDILSADLPDFPADFPADTPFSLTMAEAVKNKAEPNEPGQQVTALKRLWDVDDTVSEPEMIEAECLKCGNTEMVSGVDTSDDPVVDYLMRINKRIESKWEKEVQKYTDAEDVQLWDE